MNDRKPSLLHAYVLLIAGLLAPQLASAACTVSHQECEYVCIAYYPNGTDCKKTKKVCTTVCDDFSVKKSGDTTEHQHANKKPEADKEKEKNKDKK